MDKLISGVFNSKRQAMRECGHTWSWIVKRYEPVYSINTGNITFRVKK